MAVRILGDQFTHTHGPLAAGPTDPVLLVEARAFVGRHPCHPHKLALVLSAMRHFRGELREGIERLREWAVGVRELRERGAL